jgi:hypothetical protein
MRAISAATVRVIVFGIFSSALCFGDSTPLSEKFRRLREGAELKERSAIPTQAAGADGTSWRSAGITAPELQPDPDIEQIRRFLGLLFERPPLAFQSLLFRWGSEQEMHQDAAYVVLRSPMELVGCWIVHRGDDRTQVIINL